jgi:hypothetical protein
VAGSRGGRGLGLGAVLPVAIVLVFVGLTYHRGADSYVRIQDNLDFGVPLYRVLASEPLIGGLGDRVEAPMGGLPRNSMPSTLHLGVLLHLVGDPLWALIGNELVARLVAFVGMLLLLRDRLLREGSDLAIYGASLSFALLPFLPVAYLSVAGQPLLLHAFLDLRDRPARIWSWIVIAVFALYSSLVYIGVFVLTVLGLIVAFDLVRERRLRWAPVMALLLMASLYAVSEYRLIHQTLFDPGYVSQRVEWRHRGGPLLTSIRNAANSFLFSQNHAAAAQFPLILAAGALALLLEARRRRSWRSLAREALRKASYRSPSPALLLLVVLVLCACISGVEAFYNWQPIQDLVRKVPPARMFGFHRLQWFHPLLFGISFGLSLELLWRRRGLSRWLAATLLLGQLAWLAWDGDAWRESRTSGLTYHEFYSPEVFADIQEHIGRPTSEYRVATLGLTPGIALFNGLQVVGGHAPNYPVEYKHRFRRVIAPELERDAALRAYYDDWGVHVHLLSTELGMVTGFRKKAYYTRDQPVRRVSDLRIDAGVLRALGCEYVLSAVEIGNHQVLGLRPEGVFEHDASPWQIFLYRIVPRPSE